MYTAIIRARGILPRHNKTGRPNPGTSISDTWHLYLRPKTQSTRVYHTETKPRSGHYGSRPGSQPGTWPDITSRPHITAEYSVDSRNRTLWAKVSLHIQKPKPQASIKNKVEKIHKLFDVTMQYTKNWGREVAMAMLPPPLTKPITLPWQSGFSGVGKKEEYAKPCTKGRGVTCRKIGIMTVAITQYLLSGMPLVL